MLNTITDEEFIDILNLIIKKETIQTDIPLIKNINDNLIELSILDSLGIVLLFVWVIEIFGIPDEIYLNFLKERETFTAKDIKEFVIANQTQIYTYAEFKKEFAKCT